VWWGRTIPSPTHAGSTKSPSPLITLRVTHSIFFLII
jgi:hypothetical protein